MHYARRSPRARGIETMRRDIDDVLRDWPIPPGENEHSARLIKTRDGRPVVQVRLELGVLQMEVEGRPDGERPRGFATYLDYLKQRVGDRRSTKARTDPWKMNAEHCAEVDREFVQFYHRRMAWLALHRYEEALADVEHTLALLDLIGVHGSDPGYIARHEQFRGLVLYHRTQAAAAIALERQKPEEAVDALREGIERLRRRENERNSAWADSEDEDEVEEEIEIDLAVGPEGMRFAPPDSALIEQLQAIEAEIRKTFPIRKTLSEQLAEAVATEDYETAAKLRDQMKRAARRSSERRV
jgi:tetratricopeptide (TPR) repeat protein